MADVNDIADVELLRCAVRNCKPTTREPRWAVVGNLFGLGSIYSRQLCRKFGVDPDERKVSGIRRKRGLDLK